MVAVGSMSVMAELSMWAKNVLADVNLRRVTEEVVLVIVGVVVVLMVEVGRRRKLAVDST